MTSLFGVTLCLVLGTLVQIHANRITLDANAQELCKKYKMMCKTGKVCAVQHFDWPNNVTIPVCIPLSFVPVRNMYCQLPPDIGRCHARYIRWYFNSNTQECTHFQYGGCEGNQNNFMSKVDCEQTCMATPAIKLYENGYSALLQPSIVSSPVYESSNNNQYEALNSVIDPVPGYDRPPITRHRLSRPSKNEQNNSRTRRRLEKEKEKEKKEKKRKDRERRKELKRLRRLRKKEQRKQRKRDQRLKERKNKKKTGASALAELFEEDNEMMRDKSVDDESDIVKQTKDIATSKQQSDKERRRNEKRRERKRLKRRERRKRQQEKERKKQERLAKLNADATANADLDKNTDASSLLSLLDQGKSKVQKDSSERTT